MLQRYTLSRLLRLSDLSHPVYPLSSVLRRPQHLGNPTKSPTSQTEVSLRQLATFVDAGTARILLHHPKAFTASYTLLRHNTYYTSYLNPL